ncbi:MAG: excinuclease ABC subunit B [Candidatus Terrybacteria bacterium CG10_big_fil_rev_8_21_14_0_10_41_10]|uniref:Excinuclease ABC subunit B n=1 Tax=Candidatus Terrybacteria bacterium CG10_big_fil_rev_8_21_14_0_10_41_10 TaxID=1975026 RepID=A0A2M8LAZ2_9BACT|nr:MAG: excinuclease ABC subunit B [Candidatus Terrybacteria bacterium CG10_big_fil_rev_8_21_14_0_10_41_10]
MKKGFHKKNITYFKLHSKFKPSGDQPTAIKKLADGLKKDYDYQTLLGVTGSGKTFTMANVIAGFDRPVLVIAPNKVLAAQLYQEYKTFFPENSVNYFVSYYDYYQPEAYMPSSDTYIEKEAMINEEIDKLRHSATSALMTRRDVIVVASVSCIYNLGLPTSYAESALHLEKGKLITRGDLIRQLVKMQFVRAIGALKRATFRVRGDVFEITPASNDKIFYRIRIENQKVANIYAIDSFTGKPNEEFEDIVIFPPKHFISSEPQIKEALVSIRKELKERLDYFNKKGLLLEAQRLERRVRQDMEMIKSLGYCHGIENYSRHLTGKLPGEASDTLLSYFPVKRSDTQLGDSISKLGKAPDFLTIIDESHIAVPQIRAMYEGDRKRKETLIEYGWRLPSALDNRPLKFEEFKKLVSNVIFTSATPGVWEIDQSKQVAEQVIRPTGLIDPPVEIRPVFDAKKNEGQIDDVMREIEKVVKKGERAIINTLTKKMAEELTEFLNKKGLKSNYMHSGTKTLERTEILTAFRRGEFDALIGVNLLREGLDLPEVSFVAILDADREGFLRSETSLMQTMGRAARHLSGKVVLYADTITGSIKRAVAEVERRRKLQMEYNKKHKITPKGIKKEIKNLIEREKQTK